MKPIPTTATLVLLLAVFSPAPSRAQPAGDDGLAPAVERFLEPYVEAGYWSGVVLIARRDSVLFRGAYGLANRAHGVPNRLDTRFLVASVTKAFTAVAAARLWRAGIIEREGTIDRWLPDFPRADEITVAHLVGHRSGIPDTDGLPWFAAAQDRPHDMDALVDSLGAAGLDFPPGERYSYSNGGYTVLAASLSAATGLSYPDLMERWVYTPAGMPHTGDAAMRVVVKGLADGYTLGPTGDLVPAPAAHPSNKVGAGSAYTTIDDILRFHQALRDGLLLPVAVVDSLFGTSDSAFGRQRMYFGGRGPGYTASIQIYPEEDIVVAALGNNYARLNEEVTDGLLGILFGKWEEDRVAAILARDLPFPGVVPGPGVLDPLVGEYRHQWGFGFRLERHDEGLVYVDLEHGTRSPMIPLSDSTFISPWQWAELRFGDEPRFLWLDFPDRAWTLERR